MSIKRPKYSVVAVHGIGAGTGEERKGFSDRLKGLIEKEISSVEDYWHEANWESVNNSFDEQMKSIVDDLLDGYIEKAVAEKLAYEEQKLKKGGNVITDMANGLRRLADGVIKVNAPAVLEYLKAKAPGVLDALVDLPLYWDAERAEIIRSKVCESIRDADEDNTEGVVLLGHSLGSVIAFDVLAEAIEKSEDTPVKALVTMGSPLKWVTDLRESERKLFPEKKIRTNIEPIRWVNFFDKEDLVPLRKKLNRTIFGDVENVEVTSGKKLIGAHCAYWENEEIARTLVEMMVEGPVNLKI